MSLYPDLASGALTPAAWVRLAASLGFDGADFSVAHLRQDAAWLAALRREADDAGIQPVILAAYSDFTHPDAGYRRAQLDETRAWIDAAAALGAPFVRVTAGQAHPGVGEEDGLAWAAEGLAASMEHARTAGVRLLYENHTRGAVWTSNDFTLPASRFLEVVRRTAGSGLEILFDTANSLVLGDEPAMVLREVIHRVGAIHLSDIRRAGAFEPTLLGTGVAPLRELLDIAAEHGFDGWVSVEEASRTGIDGLRKANDTARSLIPDP